MIAVLTENNITHQSSATTETQDNRNDVYSAEAMTYSYPNTSTTLPDDDPFYPDIPPNPNPSHGCSTTLPFYPDVPNPNPGKSTTDATTTTTLPVSDSPIPVRLIVLNKSNLSLKKGEITNLTVEIFPSNASNRDVEWHSSNTKVISVSDGYICAENIGSATVTATANDENGATARCNVTVTPGIAIKTIHIPGARQMAIGESVYLEMTITPDNATNKKVLWESKNTGVVTVNSLTGEIFALAKGTAMVYANAQDGSGKRGWCKIFVTDPIPVTKIEFAKDNITTIRSDDEPFYLNVTVSPTNATNKSIKWKSDSDCVIVDTNTGAITPQHDGKATIIATTISGRHSAEWNLTVDSAPLVTVVKEGNRNLFHIDFYDALSDNIIEKTWKSVCRDMTKNENRTHLTAAEWDNDSDVDYMEHELRFNENSLQKFSIDELAFIYSYDPLGVQYYVQTIIVPSLNNNIQILRYKDTLYMKIFGIWPCWIEEHNEGELVRSNSNSYKSDSDRLRCYSDAEVLFGFHTVFDSFKFWTKFIPKLLLSIFDKYPLVHTLIKTIDNVSLGKDICNYLFLGGSFSNVFSDGTSRSIEYFNKYNFDCLNVMGWASSALDLIQSLEECVLTSENIHPLLENITPVENLIFNKISQTENFRIVFVTDEQRGRKTSMKEFIDMISLK